MPYGGYNPIEGGGYGDSNRYDQPSEGAYSSGRYGDSDVEMQNLVDPGLRGPNTILNECRDIDEGINSIERNLERLRFLQTRAIDDPDASQDTQTNRELDALGSETMTLYRSFGARIKAIKQQRESGDPKNKSQVGKVDRKLKSAINEYQQVESEFRKRLSEQIARQYRIVKPEASEDEIRAAVDDTSNNQVFSQALLQSNRRGQSQSALRAVQGRHEAIQKIERQMIELAQLFEDVNAAVVQQEAAVEDIEVKAQFITENVSKGNIKLDDAIVKAHSRNRKKWYCLGGFFILLLIIAFIIVMIIRPWQKK